MKAWFVRPSSFPFRLVDGLAFATLQREPASEESGRAEVHAGSTIPISQVFISSPCIDIKNPVKG